MAGHGGGLLETASAAQWNLDLCAKLEASPCPHVVFCFLRLHLTSMDEFNNRLSYQREPQRHLWPSLRSLLQDSLMET
jgi:hypothetical protein